MVLYHDAKEKYFMHVVVLGYYFHNLHILFKVLTFTIYEIFDVSFCLSGLFCPI